MTDKITSLTRTALVRAIDLIADMEAQNLEIAEKYQKLLAIAKRAANNSCCIFCDKCPACDALDMLREIGETK